MHITIEELEIMLRFLREYPQIVDENWETALKNATKINSYEVKNLAVKGDTLDKMIAKYSDKIKTGCDCDECVNRGE